jgi:HAMP domain-containing protein
MSITKFFLSLSIRVKLLTAFMSILLMSVFLIATAVHTINRIIAYKEVNKQVDDLNLHFLEMNNQAKAFIQEDFKQPDYLVKGKSESLEEYTAIKSGVLAILEDLHQARELSTPVMISILDQVHQEIGNYDKSFVELTEVLKERGFRDYGTEGTLREAIHHVEEANFPYNKVDMLMLRRHEKDFFMRKDLKYLNKFNKLIAAFQHDIAGMSSKDPDFAVQKGKILEFIENYHKEFNHIVELERKIGLNDQDGLNGKLLAISKQINPQIEQLNKLIKSRTNKLITEGIILLVALFVFQFVIGFILVIFYSKVFTRAIKEIKEAAVSLSSGKFPEKMKVRTRDEIGQTKKAFNNLIERIRTAADFANRLGNGELKAQYADKYKNDVLARSIITMQDKLLSSEKEQAKVNWVNEGIAQFSDVLKSDHESMPVLADKILRKLINYMNVNQGALFLLKGEGSSAYLERMASFAYGKKKHISQRMEIGESLIGEVVLEKDTKYLTDIPNGYTTITSGLGEATPRNILMVPLKVQEKIVGVIELASFEVLEAYQLKFVEKLSENIANLFANKQINEQTQKLLEESQEKAEMMAAQEEELRQNAEELSATQEDIHR